MSDFAKRHYEAIAAVMQECKPLPTWCANKHAQWEKTVNELADMFKADNGRFDRERFKFACEPGNNVKARTAHLKTSPLVQIVKENERQALNALSRNGY